MKFIILGPGRDSVFSVSWSPPRWPLVAPEQWAICMFMRNPQHRSQATSIREIVPWKHKIKDRYGKLLIKAVSRKKQKTFSSKNVREGLASKHESPPSICDFCGQFVFILNFLSNPRANEWHQMQYEGAVVRILGSELWWGWARVSNFHQHAGDKTA